MKLEEGTLFRPDPKIGNFMGGGAGGRPGGGSPDDDEPEITLTDRLAEALRSCQRRKPLTAFVLFLGAVLTTAAAILAPKTYEIDADVLVQRSALSGGGQYMPTTPDEQRALAKEYEQQILARDNITAIVQQAELVKRWDSMRQPHRKLLDRLNAEVGKAPANDDEKLDQLVKTLEAKLKVNVEATTVNLRLEWPEPESARDIVKVAIDNFIKTRFQVEVGVVPEGVRIAEQSAKRAADEVKNSFLELQARQDKQALPKLNTPMIPGVPQVMPAHDVTAPADGDPSIKAKLDTVRGQIADRDQKKQARLQELRARKAEMEQTFAPAHPQMIELKATIAATEQDPPELTALKEQEKRLSADYEASKTGPAPPTPNKPTVLAPAPAPAPAPAVNIPRSLEDVQATFAAAQRKYEQAQIQLEIKRTEQQLTEAAFKHRYTVTHPAELPAGPKRPTQLIAAVLGLLLTILAALVAAVLRDRASGIFFEPREVRDRLKLPVFANMRK